MVTPGVISDLHVAGQSIIWIEGGKVDFDGLCCVRRLDAEEPLPSALREVIDEAAWSQFASELSRLVQRFWQERVLLLVAGVVLAAQMTPSRVEWARLRPLVVVLVVAWFAMRWRNATIDAQIELLVRSTSEREALPRGGFELQYYTRGVHCMPATRAQRALVVIDHSAKQVVGRASGTC